MSEELIKAIVELKEEEAIGLAEQALASGIEPSEILLSCQGGMTRVGELFEQKKYYLSELVYSGAIFKKISALLEEAMKNRDGGLQESKGAVVIGTVAGDVHDLGKNIVAMLLSGAGYEVFDLGVDAPPEKFIEKVKETDCRVLGVSALITSSFQGMKKIVELLGEAGLRQKVKVMIGGGVVDDMCLRFTGADMQSKNAYDAVLFCNEHCRA